MHHVYDETPAEVSLDFRTRRINTTDQSHAVFQNHVSNATFDSKTEQVDTSQYRQRGYRVGSLMTGPDDPDNYYLQPGHPLSPKADKGGRFKDLKGVHYADLYTQPADPSMVDPMEKYRVADRLATAAEKVAADKAAAEKSKK